MTFEEFRQVVRPLSVALGAEYDLPTWRLYHRALESVPLPLLQAAVEEAAQTRHKMPSAAHLRELAEKMRQQLLSANPFQACDDCNGTGWASLLVDGIPRVTRCQCYRAYQAKLAALGVGHEPLALPAARELGDDAA